MAEASLFPLLQAGIQAVVALVLGVGMLVGTALNPWQVFLLLLEDSFTPGRLLAGLFFFRLVLFFFSAVFAHIFKCWWWLKPNP